MAKKKKSSLKDVLKQRRVLLFLLGFAIVGSLIVFARAATVSDQLIAINNLAFSYSGGGIISIDRDANNNITSYTRPRAIDVSKDEIVYCTPQNEGVVTFRELTAEEKDYLQSNLITQAPEITSTSQAVSLILDEPTVYVDGFADSDSIDSYTKSGQPAFVDGAITYLEQLCSVPGEAIPSGSSPDIIIAQNSDQQRIFNSVAETLAPKAYAGGTTPTTNINATIVSTFEAGLRTRLANTRSSAGKKSVVSTICINTASKDWSTVMAWENVLYHDKIPNRMVEECGPGWNWVGENVGRCSLKTTANTTYLQNDIQKCWNEFMESTGHRDNILDGRMTNFGTGAAISRDSKYIFVTQKFWGGRLIPK